MKDDTLEVVEQNGNYFKKTSKGYEYINPEVEQNGNIFKYNPTKNQYEFSAKAEVAKEPISFQKDFLEAAKETGKRVGGAALKGLAFVGEQIDRFTGAPARSALEAGLSGESPLSAYIRQFGKSPESAPTGKDIMAKHFKLSEDEYMGIPGTDFKFSPAGAAGLLTDIVVDPTNIIPGKPVLQFGAKATSKIASETGNLARVAANVASKGKYEDIEKGLVASAKSIKEAFNRHISSPTVSTSYKEFSDIAKRNGIDPKILPESIEFGEASAINRAARAVRESPAGQEELVKFINAQDQVNNALEKRINLIANGTSKSKLNAGNALREGYDQAVDNLFKNIDFTYNEIVRQAPDITITRPERQRLYKVAQEIIDDSKKKLSGYTTPEHTKQLSENIKAAEKIQNSLFIKKINEQGKEVLRQAPNSFSSLVVSLQNIGESGYKNKHMISEVPPDLQTMRKLYTEIRKSLVETTGKRLGEDIKKSLETNNELLTTFFKDRESFFNKLNDKRLSGEQLFTQIVNHGNTNEIRDIIKIMPEKLPEIKGAFLESIITRNVDGDILYNSFSKALKRNEETVKLLFNKDEIKELGDLIKLGNSFGPAVLSTSGTGASLSYQKLTDSIKNFATTKTALEYMKAQARKVGSNVPTPTTPVLPPISSPPTSAKTILGELLAPRGKVESRGKIAQVYSTQDQNDRNAMERRLNLYK